MLHVGDDSDDLAQTQLKVYLGRPVATKAQSFEHEGDAFAERILVGPIATRHCFVDGRDLGCVLCIAVIEFPALDQPNAHRFEVGWAHVAIVRTTLLAGAWFRRAFDQQNRAAVNAAERQVFDGAGGFDPRQSRHSFQELLIEGRHLVGSGYRDLERLMFAVRRLSDRNPGSVSRNREKLRISSPAPTSNTNDSATSPTTRSASPFNFRPREEVDSLESLMTWFRSG